MPHLLPSVELPVDSSPRTVVTSSAVPAARARWLQVTVTNSLPVSARYLSRGRGSDPSAQLVERHLPCLRIAGEEGIAIALTRHSGYTGLGHVRLVHDPHVDLLLCWRHPQHDPHGLVQTSCRHIGRVLTDVHSDNVACPDHVEDRRSSVEARHVDLPTLTGGDDAGGDELRHAVEHRKD